jgi:hypothetical protein
MTGRRLHQCPPGNLSCPICRARAVLVLLRTARPRMALLLAEDLDGLIVEALGQAHLAGWETAHKQRAPKQQPRAKS